MKTTIFHKDSISQTLATKERVNAFQCGHGEHASAKYPKRAKSKRNVQKEIRQYY